MTLGAVGKKSNQAPRARDPTDIPIYSIFRYLGRYACTDASLTDVANVLVPARMCSQRVDTCFAGVARVGKKNE